MVAVVLAQTGGQTRVIRSFIPYGACQKTLIDLDGSAADVGAGKIITLTRRKQLHMLLDIKKNIQTKSFNINEITEEEKEKEKEKKKEKKKKKHFKL